MRTRLSPSRSSARPPSEATRAGPTRRGALLVAGILSAASFIAAACGSSGSAADRVTILDTEKIERAIEHSVLAQRGTHVQVSCPSGVRQTKGSVFSCTVIEGGTARFVVTQLDGSGHVRYEAR
jgi:Domain of unknown function (DUF4333)